MSTSATLRIGTEKYPALTGIRAFGASVVFFDHFPLWAGLHLTLNVMAFFYALSGFLIVRLYFVQASLSRQWLATYFVNRFARIYPVYFLLLSVAVLLGHDLRPGTLLLNYTLTHALFYHSELIIQPSWSLTVEECFYFLAPVFMLLTRRYEFAAAFLLGCLLLVLALIISRLDIGFLQTPGFVLSTTFFGHFLEFFAGVYLALAVMWLEKRGPVLRPGAACTVAGLAGVSVLAVAMIIAYRHVPLSYLTVLFINNVLMPAPITLLYWGLIRERTALSSILSSRLFGLLGRASYVFYLLHTILINYLSAPWLASRPALRPACVLLTFALTWLISIVLYIHYEEPINRRIRQGFKARSQRAAARASQARDARVPQSDESL